MITNDAFKLYESGLTSISWLEKYGGLTRRMKNPNATAGQEDVLYPISKGANYTTCWQNNNFMKIVPDDNYKSLLWFEQLIDDVVADNEQFGRGSKQFSSTYRGYLYLNWANLGQTESQATTPFISDILTVFKDRKQGNGIISEIAISQFDNDITMQNNVREFNWNNVEKLFYYPNAMITFRFNINAVSNLTCLASSSFTDPIPCENLSYVSE